jgi:hypothetical protein
MLKRLAKWWRRYKNQHGWDFKTRKVAHSAHMRRDKEGDVILLVSRKGEGIYSHECKYCGMTLTFPYEHSILAFHNMQRHLRAKHDVL